MIHCKKIILNAAAGALTLALAVSFASAAFGTGVVTEGPLRLRESASTDAEVLARVAEGVQVEILEDAQNGWYKVSYKGETGYMSGDYLAVTPVAAEAEAEALSALEAPAAPAEATAPEAEWALVDTSVLNVRAGPGTDFDKVGKLYGGSVVSALVQEGDWTLVEYGSVEGYVSSEYLIFGAYDELKAASSSGQQIVDIAKQYLGVRYRYGGASPSGFDCSGFVYYVAKQAGYSVPRTGSAMWSAGYAKVDKADLQPGDIVFFTGTGGGNYITHVGIYVGNGKFIHSSSPSSGGVIITSLSERYYATRYVGARRAFT